MKIDLVPLKHSGDDHVFDPGRERALLAAFDAAQRQPRAAHTSRRSLSYLAAAAVIVVAAGTALLVERRPNRVEPATAPLLAAHAAPQLATVVIAPGAPEHHAPRTVAPTPAPSHPAPRMSAFVAWPGADTLPTFESGRLMRLDLPEPLVISLGLRPRASHAGVVRADILVGQDGLARAVRVAP